MRSLAWGTMPFACPGSYGNALSADDVEDRPGMSAFVNLFRSLSRDENEKGDQFEFVTKHLLMHSPVHASLFKQVFLWDEWPYRDGPDVGVDLVGELSDGSGFCAIQAKAYDPSYSIRKEDLDSFISASPPSRFCCRLLVATTNRIGPNATRVLRAHPNTAVVLRSHIDALPLSWPATIDALLRGVLPQRQPLPTPYEYQRTATSAVVSSLGVGGRGQLIMPCGTGKTLLAYWIQKELNSTRVLFTAPALSLIRKTLATWAFLEGTLPPWMVVCSDESVAKNIALDPYLSQQNEFLCDLTVPVTTDMERIRAFMKANGRCWVFSTYQSISAVAEAMADPDVDAFSLAICDEAHRLVGSPTHSYGAVLSDAMIACSRRLFMTATPRTYRRLITASQSNGGTGFRDMADVRTFGESLHRVGLAEAVEKGWLADYRVLVLVADEGDADALLGRGGNFLSSGGAPLGRHAIAVALATLKAMESTGVRRLISFHSSIKKAKEFHDALKELYGHGDALPTEKLIIRHVHGGMSAARREEVLEGFSKIGSDARMIVTNARCLGEGVDVPSLDAVVFADPKNSYVEIVQAVGRAIRPSAGKTTATVVVPVIVRRAPGQEGDVDLKSSAFKFVWQVLSAIRSHDTRLGDEIDAYAREYARTGEVSGLPKRLSILNISPIPLDPVQLNLAFSARLYEAVALSDMYALGKAEKYAGLNGSIRGIPATAVIDGFGVGMWVARQRWKLRRERLDPAIKQRLDAIGMVWDVFGEQWQDIYDQLKDWIRTESGRSAGNVSQDVEFGSVNACKWLQWQRHCYRTGKLSQQRIQMLEEIGFIWAPHDAKWQTAIEACEEWCELHGDLSSIGSNTTLGDYPIGTFIAHQRVFFKRRELSTERVRQLEAMGIVWDRKDVTWLRNFRACEHYVAHVGPINDVNANGPPYKQLAIGRWLHHQRQLRKNGRLREDRKKLLDGLGISWTPKKLRKHVKGREERQSTQWLQMLALCDEFIAAHPGQRIKNDTMFKGKKIGHWLRNHLHWLRKGKLPADRAALLESRSGLFRC